MAQAESHQSKKTWRPFFLLGIFSGLLVFYLSSSPIAIGSKIINRPESIIYIPSGLKNNTQYPLVLAFSPSANAPEMIEVLRPVAEKYKWLILASKKTRNGENPYSYLREINALITQDQLDLPIDKKRILATGLSGGGMVAHSFTYDFPALISAVIINTGMMDAEFYYPLKNKYPRDKIAVFLASPTDFRYREMHNDRKFLEDLGWRTHWIEFQGGHRFAPSQAYEQAARWLIKEWQNNRTRHPEEEKKY